MGHPPPISLWKLLTGFARTILHTRVLRRRLLFHGTLLLLCFLGLGVLMLELIPRFPLLMLAYWSGFALFTVIIFLLALYDLLAVRRELRDEDKADRDSGNFPE